MDNMKTTFIECGGVGDSCPHMEADRRCQLTAGACTLQLAEATRPPAPFGLLERFVMWFAPHIRNCAFFYVLGCYFAFTGLNLLWLRLRLDDPYGIAMVLIGMFWLAIIFIFDCLKRRYT